MPGSSVPRGQGVDAIGGPVIDPTKNVLDLVKAESETRDKLREADEKLAQAETRRINELAQLRAHYDSIIEGIRSKSLDSTSTLLATQLREVKNDLSERVAKLEQFRWETGGRGAGTAATIGYLFAGVAAGGVIVGVIMSFVR